MLGYAKIFKDKVYAEGKAEGKAERDAEWIEWAANGKDPDKMPSKINPIKTISNKEESEKSKQKPA